MLARLLAPVLLVAVLLPPRVDPVSGMTFALIPAGSFEMGTPPSEPGRETQERLHTVTLTRSFFLAIHEVTQAQWSRVMDVNPSQFRGCADCPVERVSYFDVQEFIRRLNRDHRWPGFRLPSEAEWEYACRAGGRAAFGSSAVLSRDRANVAGTRTTRVGAFPANAFGLFDMSGNVWEWTSDDHCAYSDSAPRDPHARCTSDLKVIRGGSWRFAADSARCGLRYTHRPRDRGFSLGVRLAHDRG
jgi:formylglycine-generating enzyme required for sulfatase activity